MTLEWKDVTNIVFIHMKGFDQLMLFILKIRILNEVCMKGSDQYSVFVTQACPVCAVCAERLNVMGCSHDTIRLLQLRSKHSCDRHESIYLCLTLF